MTSNSRYLAVSSLLGIMLLSTNAQAWVPSAVRGRENHPSSSTVAAAIDSDSDGSVTAASPEFPLAEPTLVTLLMAGQLPVQNLPAGYFLGLPHFVLSTDAAEPALTVVPSSSDDQGFVNPHSLHQWWVPDGLAPAPVARLSLGALIKDGVLRAVFPALDSFTVTAASSGRDEAGEAATTATTDDVSPEAKTWRNWGLCSVPLAQVLLDRELIPLAELKLSAFASSQASKTSSEGDSISSDEASSVWHAVGGSDDGLDIEPAVTALVRMLADPPSNLAATKGFSLITVPLCPTVKSGTSEEEPGCSSSNSFFPLPLGERLRLYLTDYPVPSALLDLQVGAAAGAGALEVDVSVVASGADSEYLPEAYKPLFQPT
jgi:hypothetical protein